VTGLVEDAAEPIVRPVEETTGPVLSGVTDDGGLLGGEGSGPTTSASDGTSIPPTTELPTVGEAPDGADSRAATSVLENAAAARNDAAAMRGAADTTSLISAPTAGSVGAPASDLPPGGDDGGTPWWSIPSMPSVPGTGSSGAGGALLFLIFAAVPAAALLLANGPSRWFRLANDARVPTPYVSFEERPG
jgi:hypothetical protein